MKANRKNRKIGLILDDYYYKYYQNLWNPLAQKIIKEGSQVCLIHDNDGYENKYTGTAFDCLVFFCENFVYDVENIPYLIVGSKFPGHPSIVLSTDEKSAEKMLHEKFCSKIRRYKNLPEAEYLNLHYDGVITNSSVAAKEFLLSNPDLPVLYFEYDPAHFVNIAVSILMKLISGATNILNRTVPTEIRSADDLFVNCTYSDNERLNNIFETVISSILSVKSMDEFTFKLKSSLPLLGIEDFSFIEQEKHADFIKNIVFPREDEERQIIDIIPEKNKNKSQSTDIKHYFCAHISERFSELFTAEKRSFLTKVLFSIRETITELDSLRKEKENAENNNYKKTEFFANMGSELCDPLLNIGAKLSQMEENIDKGLLDKDIISEQLIFLKSQIETQIDKTKTLLELSSTEISNLDFEKKLWNIRTLFEDICFKSYFENNRIFFEDEIYPLINCDKEKLKKSLTAFFEHSDNVLNISLSQEGINFVFVPPFSSDQKSEKEIFDFSKPEMALAEKVLLLHYAVIFNAVNYLRITLPYPTLSHQRSKKVTQADKIYSLKNEKASEIYALPVKYFFEKKEKTVPKLFYWNSDNSNTDDWLKVNSILKNEKLSRVPVICYSGFFEGKTFSEGIKEKIFTEKKDTVLFVGCSKTKYEMWATEANTVTINSSHEIDEVLKEIKPALIVFEKCDIEAVKKIRKDSKLVTTPILFIPEDMFTEKEVERICEFPKILYCNHGVCESEEFGKRICEIIDSEASGSSTEILPPHTGALVKKAIYYLNKNSSTQIVRWKLADSVHVSEDYLTRVFHQETGLSLWEYLTRYRIFIARKMLLETNSTIYEIAEKTGFQDQAYFCRVFKKIYGIPPGKIRTK